MDYETEFKKWCGDNEILIKEIENLKKSNLWMSQKFNAESGESKKLKKANAELLIKLFDKNAEIKNLEDLRKSMLEKINEFQKVNNELMQKNIDRNSEITILKNCAELSSKRNGSLNNELNYIKSKWYVKLFHREKKPQNTFIIKDDLTKMEGFKIHLKGKKVENETWYNNFINRHNPAGLPDVNISKNLTPPDGETGESE